MPDHLGSIRVVIDEDGNTVETFDYDPFGKLLRHSVISENSKRGYTGYAFEPEAGLDLYFANARYYDAEVGRFNGVDPVKEYSSPYAYVSNNPISFVDPMRTRRAHAEYGGPDDNGHGLDDGGGGFGDHVNPFWGWGGGENWWNFRGSMRGIASAMNIYWLAQRMAQQAYKEAFVAAHNLARALDDARATSGTERMPIPEIAIVEREGTVSIEVNGISSQVEFYSLMMANAASHEGSPYERGGSGPGTFDCSGFVCYVINETGGNITRAEFSAQAFPENGYPGFHRREGGWENRQHGDVLLWRTSPHGSHMGFWDAGRNTMLHAANGPGRVEYASERYMSGITGRWRGYGIPEVWYYDPR